MSGRRRVRGTAMKPCTGSEKVLNRESNGLLAGEGEERRGSEDGC
jgi:hypothetical protein